MNHVNGHLGPTSPAGGPAGVLAVALVVGSATAILVALLQLLLGWAGGDPVSLGLVAAAGYVGGTTVDQL